MLSDCLELYRTLKHIYVGLIRFHSNLIDFFSLYWICFEKNHPWEMVKTVSAFLFCLVRLTSWKQIGKHLFFSSRSVKEYLAPREPHFQNNRCWWDCVFVGVSLVYMWELIQSTKYEVCVYTPGQPASAHLIIFYVFCQICFVFGPKNLGFHKVTCKRLAGIKNQERRISLKEKNCGTEKKV